LDAHVTPHNNAKVVYERPRIEKYGTLHDITAHLERALPAGIGVAGASSVPTGPPPGGPPPGELERTPPGPLPSENPPQTGTGGEETFGGGGGGGGGGSGVAGAEMGGGGGGGGGGTVSGGAAELPFTGFPAAVAGAVGAGLASAGAALRRVLKRR
jgi:hypothetical protein